MNQTQDTQKLNSLLTSGALLPPVSDAPGLVDFATAIHHAIGATKFPLDGNAAKIRALLGDPAHLIFALIDGFGMNYVDRQPPHAFIRRNLTTEMRSVFPSTTAAALTTLATGEWPATHAITGWHVLIPQISAVSTIIAYQRSPDKTPLSQLGIPIHDAYPIPSRMRPSSHINAACLMPAHITNTPYSTYWAAGIPQIPYKTTRQAVHALTRRLARADRPTFTYLYMPQVDSAAHKHGAYHATTMRAARNADETLERIATALPPNARLVMTADHGHLDAPASRVHKIAPGDPILSLSETPPSGDVRLMYAHVRPDNLPAFRRAVRNRLGDDFLVLTAPQLDALRLLGPDPIAPETRRRIGNALILSTTNAVLDYRAALGENASKRMRSHHSGLTPAEMRIPLVIV